MLKNALSVDEVLAVCADARERGASLTNFYPDWSRIESWCLRHQLCYGKVGESLFLIRVQDTFSTLWFLTSDADALAQDVGTLKEVCSQCVFVVDLVGADVLRQPLESVFSKAGFRVYATLQRMGRRTPAEAETDVPDGVTKASESDVASVVDLLHRFFDPVTDQLPSTEEVLEWQRKGGLWVSRDACGAVNGFVIFDVTPAVLYLRYWFVKPDCRGLGLGAHLLHAMFAMGAKTKRQYFWVLTNNENAIKRYRHYGFEFEAMKDSVMVSDRPR